MHDTSAVHTRYKGNNEEIWKTLQPHTQDFLRKVAKQVVEAMPDTNKALELIDMADIGK